MKFNINHKVKVRLTEKGREIHRKRWDELGITSHAYQAPKEDRHGWSEWQMWELMSEFGPHMWNGCNVPFETEIKIPQPARHI